MKQRKTRTDGPTFRGTHSLPKRDRRRKSRGLPPAGRRRPGPVVVVQISSKPDKKKWLVLMLMHSAKLRWT